MNKEPDSRKQENPSLQPRAVLNHALKLINSPLVVEERLSLLGRIIAEIMSVDDVAIFLKEPDSDTLVLRTTVGLNPIAVGNLRVPIGKGVTGLVAQTRKNISSRNILDDPRSFYSAYSEDERFPSMLSSPIVNGDELVGVVNIRSSYERDFTDREAEELKNFTASIAGSIQNARTHERLEYKARLLELSINIAGSLTSTLDLDTVLDEISWEIANGFNIQGVLIQLMDREGKVKRVATHGLRPGFVKNLSQELPKSCLLTGEPKIRTTEFGKPFGDVDKNVWNICLPLISQNKTLGVMSLFGIEDEGDPENLFLSIGVDVLLHISGIAALAIENAVSHHELKRLAEEEKRKLDTISVIHSRMTAIFDSIMDGIVAVDEKGVIRDFNNIAGTSLGLGEKDKGTCNIDSITSYKPPLSTFISGPKEFSNRVVTFETKADKFAALVTMRSFGTGNGIGCVISFRPMKETAKLLTRFSSQRPRYTFEDMIGNDTTLAETVRLARLAAQSSANILILGESGTGKELFSQSIHNASPVAEGPFVPVNCAAIPKDLIESELFGYAEGAFTGARKGGYIGKFEQATGGTIFLDEVGDMPLELQVKLLRVLQEKVIQRVGSEMLIPISTRVISATNRDLNKMIRDGEFREELYWRLNVVTIDIPPLRDRKIDIPEFVRKFIEKFSVSSGREVKSLEPSILPKLIDYPWKGNVRELENAIEHTVLMSESKVIRWGDFPAIFRENYENKLVAPQTAGLSEARKERADSSRKLYREAIVQSGGDIVKAAETLGISRATLYRRLKKYGLTNEIASVRNGLISENPL